MGLLDRFPSFRQLQAGAVTTLRRFPLTLLSAILGTVVAIVLKENPDGLNRHLLEKLLLAAALGLPLFTALTLFVEKRQWRRQANLACQVSGVVLLAAYFFSLPDGVFDLGANPMRFALLNIGLHFLVACLPYIGGNQTHGFWQYNMSLFHRFLTAAVFSGVMYIGLAIALAAWDHLFGFEVEPERYFQLWVVMVGAFNTWIFLAGVPKDLEALDQATEYPKGLSVFAQYILLPLVALYFVILISYEAKIIITWNWPKGWVSELVLWFSVVGLLSLLALYPLRKQADKRWVQTFVKWFFRVMIPLVGMLFLAILRRISDYGVTEPRYFVLAMAVGLVIVTLYFLISKARDIRIIPILLAVAALLSAYGPWSASSVSLWSQQGRLKTLLTQNGLLVDGSIQEVELEPSFDDRKEMSSIIEYVIEWHGVASFSKWIGEDAISSLDTVDRYSQPGEIAEIFGFEHVGPHYSPESATRFSISGGGVNSNVNSLVVTGFDYLVDFTLGDGDGFEGAYSLDADSCSVFLDRIDLALIVSLRSERSTYPETIRFHLAGRLDSLVDEYDDIETPIADRTFVSVGDSYEARLVLEHVTGDRVDDGLQIRRFSGHLLIRRD